MATLIGSLVGLSVIGWQTRQGFRNLIASQEHRARIEREAVAEQVDRDRKALAAALSGELLSAWHRTKEMIIWYTIQAQALKEINRAGKQEFEMALNFPQISTPVYEANVSRLGLLGSSVAGDVARVFSRMSVTTQPKPVSASIDIWIKTLEGMAEAYPDLLEDISYVVKRLHAVEYGMPIPGPLNELEQERARKKKEAAS